MKSTIRCCISCILPCGALDVIRIVHSNGHVEEISGSVRAAEILRAHPRHVLKKPSSPPSDEAAAAASAAAVALPKIVVVPPDAQLQRGKIYFLMPAPPPPPTPAPEKKPEKRSRPARQSSRRRKRDHPDGNSMTDLLISDRYLSEILSEKVSTQGDRRRGRAGVWRPHLESISEAPADL